MRIILLYPKWTTEYGLFSYIARKASIWPPLNLAYLAAIAEGKGHTVRIIDGEAENIPLQKMVKETHKFKPDIIGITATTPFYHIAVELARQFKQGGNGVPIVIGGTHITMLKEKVFDRSFDYAFIGESELSWPQFLNAYESGKDISDIKGILYRKGEAVIFSGMPDIVDDLDTLPPPARHLLKVEKYRLGTPQGIKRFSTIMTSRGCPFQCIFCSSKVFGYSVRRRSLQLVIDEMKTAINGFNIRHFYLLDDNITLDRKYMFDFCHAIQNQNLPITFEGGTRANLVDEEIISTMKKSGLVRIAFGLESADPKIRKIMKKEVPIEDYEKANKLVNKYKIETLNSAILGLPGETRQTAEKTLNYLQNSREVQLVNLTIATPYPGTELYEMAKNKEHGLRLLSEDFSRYRRYGSPVMEVNDLSAKDLLALQNDGYLRIYSAPWRIKSMLRKHGLIGGLLTLSRLINKITRNIFRNSDKSRKTTL